MISSHTTSAQRLALWIRSGGACERCGRKVGRKGWDAHHRVKQSLGGLEYLSNLVLVDRACHNAVHRADQQALELRLGWLVRSWLYADQNPPILLWDGWHSLDDGGGKARVDSPLPS